jgi:hypothetical protein
MAFAPGLQVRLRSLQSRPSLNGAHAIVTAAASSSEAALLEEKGRIKVRVASDGEILSVRAANAESINLEEDAIFSTADFAIVWHPDRGYSWKARRALREGRVLWREEPLLAFQTVEHLADPVVQAIQEKLAPYLGMESYPPEVLKLFDQSAERIAQREFTRMSKAHQRRFMALSDAFSTPSAQKTVGGIYRTNVFERSVTEGLVLFDTLSRANHACAPNIAKSFEGYTAVVSTLRDVAEGEELFLSYIGADVGKPTNERRELLKRKYNFVCTCERCGELPDKGVKANLVETDHDA